MIFKWSSEYLLLVSLPVQILLWQVRYTRYTLSAANKSL